MQAASRGSASVFSLLQYICFHFLSLSSFTSLLSRLPANCSKTCKAHKINSRNSRNRTDGCSPCLFPQNCNFISHRRKFRVNKNIKMFFFQAGEKRKSTSLNRAPHLSSPACRLFEPLQKLSNLCSSLPAEDEAAAAAAAAALLTCRTCCGWESTLIGGGVFSRAQNRPLFDTAICQYG